LDIPDPLHSGARLKVGFVRQLSLQAGEDDLYEELHGISTAAPPNALHEFFASPGVPREAGFLLLIFSLVTTNYDDALERAFEKCNEPYDLFFTRPTSTARACSGIDLDRPEVVVEHPNEHEPDLLEHRPAILKIHGAVNPLDANRDSFVITEDHYIEHLAHSDISNLVAIARARMRQSHFMFLGYSLRTGTSARFCTESGPNDTASRSPGQSSAPGQARAEALVEA
jgi:hypothetical protein